MDFIVAERDLQFVLFEYLQIQKLLAFPRWKDYDLETLKMTLTEAIKTATGLLAPLNATGDEEGAHFADGKVATPKGFKEAYAQYAQGGWLGMVADAEFGGQGLPATLGLACSEAFVSANNALTICPGLTSGGAAVIADYGSDEQKRKYVAKMLSGEWTGTMCLTEPQAGSAVGDVRTLATPDGDGRWNIVGTKMFISFGDHDMTKQIVHLVLARTPDAPPGIKGISLFIVPKYRVGAGGALGEFNDVKCSGIEHKMGLHASPTCTLNFGDAGQCVGELIGERHKGIVYMFKLMNEARVGVGLQGLSQAALAYHLALQYAKERVQGTDILAMKDPHAPRIEIVKHPDVRRMLLSMKALVEGCRALLLSVAYFEDMLLATKDPNWHMLVELLTPICKAYCTDRGFEATATAIQVLGGYGYCTEYGVEQLCRDAKSASIYEGTNGIQALDLVGRKLGQGGGLFFMNFMNRMTDMVNAHKTHPALGELIADFDKAKNKLAEVTMGFMMKGRANPLYPVSYATPYLAMMGDVTLAYLLLDMALTASEKLDAIYAEKAAVDDAAKKALRQTHAEAAFYHGKIQTARFFVKQMLPDVFAKAMAAASEDMSLLDIEL